MTKTIVALFERPSDAKRAVQELLAVFPRNVVAMTNGASDAAAMRLLQSGDLAEQEVAEEKDGIQDGGTLVVVRTAELKAQQAVDILATFETIGLNAQNSET